MRGRPFGGEGRLGSRLLRMVRGRILLDNDLSGSLSCDQVLVDLPLGFGDVSIVYKSFMLLMS